MLMGILNGDLLEQPKVLCRSHKARGGKALGLEVLGPRRVQDSGEGMLIGT